MTKKAPETAPDQLPGHPIQVVVRRTGLSPDVLRVWERRHHAVQPSRSAGRQRMYTEGDIARLSLLGQLTRRGHRIGELAQLSADELRLLVQQDAAAQLDQAAPSSSVEERALASAMAAIEKLDARGLAEVLQGAGVVLDVGRLLEGVMMPFLHRIGELWSRGELRPSHEHLATTVVRRTLADALAKLPVDGDAPSALFTAPAGHHHELGALAAAVAAAGRGWRVIFLGADVPAEDIAQTAHDVGASLVGLSIACDEEGARTAEQIELTARALPRGATLIVGGHGAGGIAKELAACGAKVIPSLSAFQELLDDLSAGRPR